MKCEQAAELLVDSWREGLPTAEERALAAHLEGCAPCRAEAASLAETWTELGAVSDVEVPSERMRERFHAALAALEAQRTPLREPTPWRDLLAALWPLRPAAQMALAGACLALGIGIGYLLPGGLFAAPGNGEIVQLRAEMASISRTVGLALLEHRSASERLRGVSWSARALGDEQIVGALLETAESDASVNVRLAAVEALGGLAGSPAVHGRLASTARGADSPLLQAAILRLLVAGNADDEVRALVESKAVDAAVLERVLAEEAGSV